MRLVLDTNVVVSALLWRGSPRRLLTAAQDRRIQLFASMTMLRELSDVLGRDKFRAKVAASGTGVDGLIEGYATLCTVVRPTSIRAVAPDPDDDVVIATGIAARADLIVTGDLPFLGVGAEGGVTIVSVADAIAALPAA